MFLEKFTPLAKILHCRRQWRHWQISPLFVGSTHANSGEVLWGRPRLPSRQDNLHCRFCGKVLFSLSLSMIFILLRQHMVIFLSFPLSLSLSNSEWLKTTYCYCSVDFISEQWIHIVNSNYNHFRFLVILNSSVNFMIYCLVITTFLCEPL